MNKAASSCLVRMFAADAPGAMLLGSAFLARVGAGKRSIDAALARRLAG